MGSVEYLTLLNVGLCDGIGAAEEPNPIGSCSTPTHYWVLALVKGVGVAKVLETKLFISSSVC